LLVIQKGKPEITTVSVGSFKKENSRSRLSPLDHSKRKALDHDCLRWIIQKAKLEITTVSVGSFTKRKLRETCKLRRLAKDMSVIFEEEMSVIFEEEMSVIFEEEMSVIFEEETAVISFDDMSRLLLQ